MIVTRRTFDFALHSLSSKDRLALDTETTGLRPYHGSVLFSIILHDGAQAYYFNFNQYDDIDEHDERYLTPDVFMPKLKAFCAARPSRLWIMHNAKYDMAMLANEGIELVGEIHCTMALERVRWNDLPPGSYDLANCGQRIGHAKDDTVKKYIMANGLTSPNILKIGKGPLLHFERVPFSLIVPYAETDARITFQLAAEQEKAFAREDQGRLAGWPRIAAVVANEKALTPTLFEIEKLGVKVDLDYCKAAMAYEASRHASAKDEFFALTGKKFKKSTPLFREIFASEQHLWGKTKARKNKSGKSGDSFDKKVMAKFKNPAAALVRAVGETKTSMDYFKGFLKHADAAGIIHTNFNQAGADTGRMSSSGPNLQNMKKPDEDDAPVVTEYPVRRAIVPRDGNVFTMFDYDQLQYRLMLDYCGAMAVIDKVKGGLDVHGAMAEMAGISRPKAKNTNFSILFGAGDGLLATNLGVSLIEGRAIKESVFRAAPEMKTFIDKAKGKAETRKFVFSWLGRRFDYPIFRMAYTAVNKIIQGGEAEMMKLALNRVREFLSPYKTRIVLSVHDEIVCEGPPDEARELAPKIKEIMEGVYPHRHLPMTVGASYSYKSLADKEKGYVP